MEAELDCQGSQELVGNHSHLEIEISEARLPSLSLANDITLCSVSHCGSRCGYRENRSSTQAMSSNESPRNSNL